MMAVGEETGALDAMLGKVADFYDQEVDDSVNALTSLIEPILIIVMAVAVGGILISPVPADVQHRQPDPELGGAAAARAAGPRARRRRVGGRANRLKPRAGPAPIQPADRGPPVRE